MPYIYVIVRLNKKKKKKKKCVFRVTLSYLIFLVKPTIVFMFLKKKLLLG